MHKPSTMDQLIQEYQKHVKLLVSKETKHRETPLKDLELEIAELKGKLKGLERGIELLDSEYTAPDLFGA